MEGRNNLFWKVLFSLLIMAVYGSCSAAYAAEFGGFEVSTGTGEYEGTGEEWRMSRYAIHQNRMTVILM